MKIAVVAPTYLPALRANTIQVMKMTQALTDLGHETRLAVPTPDPKEIAHRWDKLAVHYGLQNEFTLSWLLAKPLWRGYDFAYRAMCWARGWSADLLYTRHPQTAAFGSLLGFSTILEIHDLPNRKMGERLFRAFLWGKGAQRLVVITHALASDLCQCFPRILAKRTMEFIITAPDGVDLVRYRGLPSQQESRRFLRSIPEYAHIKIKENAFVAGYSGHLYPGRGIDLLLSLAEQLPHISFLLMGGERNSVINLEQQVKYKELRNVIITGFISNADLPIFQSACDVLLMPYQERVEASSGGDISRYLSPMKAFEYLACGRPIIVSNLPVFREIFSAKNSLLVSHHNLEEWVLALRLLQEDPSQGMNLGEQARRDAEEYDWVKRASKIMENISYSN